MQRVFDHRADQSRRQIAGAHGAVCAALLPHVMAANVQALQDRRPDCSALQRYDEIASLLLGNFSGSFSAKDSFIFSLQPCDASQFHKSSGNVTFRWKFDPNISIGNNY